MRLTDLPLTDDDCKNLVDLLHRVGRADDLEVAGRIEWAVADANRERRAKLLYVSSEECDLLLGVLRDPPAGRLSELRAALADHGDVQQ
jgi:hypothetical protein